MTEEIIKFLCHCCKKELEGEGIIAVFHESFTQFVPLCSYECYGRLIKKIQRGEEKFG